MTARDRIIIVAVAVAAALGGFWFLALAPKRNEAADLKTQIGAAIQKLADAQQQAGQARQAKAQYDADYAQVAKLGKAVPKDDALPSLLYQLQSAAHAARIDFTSLQAAGDASQAASGSATVVTKPATGSSTAGTSSAPATQSAVAGLPPGATVGSAGFPTMPFSFAFNGSFFDMERFLRNVQHFVRVEGEHVDVRGRLLSVDGFVLSAGPAGFPDVTAKITATGFLLSPNDDTSSAAPTSPSAAGSGGAPSALASGGTR